MKRKQYSFSTGIRGKLVFALCLFFISISAYAQIDACGPVGWVNYSNSTFAGAPTGGGAASPVTVTTISQLKTAANSSGAKVIYVQGVMGAGYIDGGGERVDVKSDKTIIGYPGAQVNAFFSVKNASNVIIRNLIIHGPGSEDVDGWDNMTVDNSTRVWIDHCEFKDGEDGNLDIKNASNNITVTWSIFRYTEVTKNRGGTDHSLSNLIGSSDGDTQDAGKLKVTFQYCWWDGAKERMPRVRFGQVHIANCYFSENTNTDQISKLGITNGYDADVKVENNYFDNIDDPVDRGKEDGTSRINPTGNICNACSGTIAITSGCVGLATPCFTPPYSLSVITAATLQSNIATFKSCVGATLTAPPASTCPCSSSLPVELISFTIFQNENNYLLTWEIAETETLEKIVIETSDDGINFESFKADSNKENQSIISGSDIITSNIQYVRLKLIETGGTITFSPVRSTGEIKSLAVFPNPFSHQLEISGLNKGHVQLLTIEGNIVYENPVPSSGILNLEHLPAGFYFIILYNELTNEVKRMPVVKY